MVGWVIKFTKTSFFCIFLCFSPKAPEDSRYFHYITMTKRLEHIIFPVFSTLYHIIYMYFNLCTLCVCSWQTVEEYTGASEFLYFCCPFHFQSFILLLGLLRLLLQTWSFWFLQKALAASTNIIGIEITTFGSNEPGSLPHKSVTDVYFLLFSKSTLSIYHWQWHMLYEILKNQKYDIKTVILKIPKGFTIIVDWTPSRN